ncbi:MULTISPECIES: hypothetical protein [unclassified Streptomyces]|uniref:hypothetical protein n=1 Tax=unclassified Streptomyces TaxID=2593676 RepID=UPI00068BA16B|nr:MULTISPECIES: hypothetical protein [unclassified Streptomyces]
MNAKAIEAAARRWRPARHPTAVTRTWAWPAYMSVLAQLVYAGEKGSYAAQGRLGIPGGPLVSASQYAETSDVALTQWTLALLGLLSAAIALAAVRPWGGLAPRPLLLLGLWATGALAAVSQIHVVRDVLFPTGPGGWSVWAAVQGGAGLCLWLATAWIFTLRLGCDTTAVANTGRDPG